MSDENKIRDKLKQAASNWEASMLESIGFQTEPTSWAEAFEAGAEWAIKHDPRVLKLIEALEDIFPNSKNCEHDYEPNTTMDYFRCDKCGIRPKLAEALKEWKGE